MVSLKKVSSQMFHTKFLHKQVSHKHPTPSEVAEQFFESYFEKNPLSQEEIRQCKKKKRKSI